MTLEGTHTLRADLHRPNSTTAETDFTVIGIPFDGLASARKGAALAPERIRFWSRSHRRLIPPTRLFLLR